MANSSAKLNGHNVLITGGSGLVGSRLSELLAQNGHSVSHLSRNPTKGTYESFHWDIKNQAIDKEAIKNADIIIHLAGSGVAEKRWNKERKEEIYNSRIDSTKLLFESVKNHNSRLKQFICASAIGYYGWDTGQKLVDESAEKGKGFLADVVDDWELEADRFSEIGIPVAKVRIGIVLSEKGGALTEILKPIKMGVGAALGSGNQYMSWIHIDDLCRIFIHLLEDKIEGTYNGVGPEPVTNKVLTKALGKAVNKAILLPPVPAFMLRLIVGEMQVMLTGGNRVSSKKVEETGFKFNFTSLDSALKNLL